MFKESSKRSKKRSCEKERDTKTVRTKPVVKYMEKQTEMVGPFNEN